MRGTCQSSHEITMQETEDGSEEGPKAANKLNIISWPAEHEEKFELAGLSYPPDLTNVQHRNNLDKRARSPRMCL